jgi:hypothetical protein
MRYREFRFDSDVSVVFSFFRDKICTYENGKGIIHVVSLVAIEWWSLQMIPTRLFFDLYNLQTFWVANPV